MTISGRSSYVTFRALVLAVCGFLFAGCGGGGGSVPPNAPAATGPNGFAIPASLARGVPPSPPSFVPPAPRALRAPAGRGTAAVHAPFFAGEAALSNGVYYLALPNGNPFGYYSYLTDSNYIYHFDMGYEYVVDANDGRGGVYFYDFASSHWWYTGRTYPFPYVYDFGLSALLYYYPDTQRAGRYTTNPRYFYNFKTGQIIRMPDPEASNSGSGMYVFDRSPNQITSVQTTLTVPTKPPATGTLFLWPGLQPVDGPNFEPIDNGVLQPVLTWGPSCAPGALNDYSTWWVSGEYVNTYGNDSPNYTGCHGGPIMAVNVGDSLVMSMTLSGTTWSQVIADQQTGKSVSYAIDMQGQMQQALYFFIEGYRQNPVSWVKFTNTSFTFVQPPANGCALAPAGTADSRNTASTPVVSNAGKTCSIATITLYSPKGPVPASASRAVQPPAVSGQVRF
ncbi:MAG: hypothetical protein JWM87_1200 [Candidatus Eremiobacteraeota bacterium]|nr:hypothetical protein [Candidatus Eremiobacteraeota bacterium]